MAAINPTIKLGDKYIKVGAPNIIWVVSSLLSVADSIPHVVLHQKGIPKRQITLSVTGLQDTSIYKRVGANL